MEEAEKKVFKEYKKNEKYNQEEFNQHFDRWKEAASSGNKEVRQEQMNYIYEYCKNYVYSALWEGYRELMLQTEYRRELEQEVWCMLTEKFPRYDYEKARVTTFMVNWIRHAASVYYWRVIWGTTAYYGKVIRKINKAINEKRIEISIDTLAEATGRSKVTIRRTLEIMERRKNTSYYNGYNGLAGYC